MIVGNLKFDMVNNQYKSETESVHSSLFVLPVYRCLWMYLIVRMFRSVMMKSGIEYLYCYYWDKFVLSDKYQMREKCNLLTDSHFAIDMYYRDYKHRNYISVEDNLRYNCCL